MYQNIHSSTKLEATQMSITITLCDSMYVKFQNRQSESMSLDVRLVVTLAGGSDQKGA